MQDERLPPVSAIGGESADERDNLALDRTLLAAERTFAAWMRTGLAALASGAGAHSLLAEIVSERLEKVVASVLIICGVLCFVAGVWRELLTGNVWRVTDVKRIPPGMLTIGSGALITVSIALLVALWLRP